MSETNESNRIEYELFQWNKNKFFLYILDDEFRFMY